MESVLNPIEIPQNPIESHETLWNPVTSNEDPAKISSQNPIGPYEPGQKGGRGRCSYYFGELPVNLQGDPQNNITNSRDPPFGPGSYRFSVHLRHFSPFFTKWKT